MKIAYVLHGRFPTEKAHGIQIIQLCSALSTHASLTLFVPTIGNAAEDKAFPFLVQRIAVHQPLRRASKAGFLLEKCLFLRTAAKRIRHADFDLVVTREPLLLFLLRTQNTILEIHNLPSHIRFYLPAIRKAKKVIVKTRALEQALVRAGIPAGHIEIIQNAVAREDFAHLPERIAARESLGLRIDGPLVVYAGSFQAWKGVDTMLQAAEARPKLQFLIVGGTDKEVARKKMTASSNVTFVGAVPHAKVSSYLAAADILVLPNERNTTESELYTSPLKLFEYMAARRPILASDLPSIREALAEDEGEFFEPGDAADLARGLDALVADPEAAGKRVEKAFKRVAENTWEAYARRIVAL